MQKALHDNPIVVCNQKLAEGVVNDFIRSNVAA